MRRDRLGFFVRCPRKIHPRGRENGARIRGRPFFHWKKRNAFYDTFTPLAFHFGALEAFKAAFFS
jgi:hypothetical protein